MNTAAKATEGFAVGRTTLGGATVLSPSGSLTHESCGELRTALEQAAEAPGPAVVIDCRQVKTMDSAALELLLEWNGRLHEGRGSLRLSNLNDVCSDIMVVTRLVHALRIYGDTRQALQSGGAQ